AYNKLNGYYLQRARESGDVKYFELAERAARASLKVVADEMNTGGLAGLAQALHNLHDFAGARDHAQRLVELEPRKSYTYQILGDALLELGDYEKAEESYRQMQRMSGGLVTFTNEVRLARLDHLHGRMDAMKARYTKALVIASESVPTVPEDVAWCRWQLGEAAFAEGNYEKAEQAYRDALTTYPDYYRALASLGRVRAARGDLGGAIEQYEKVVKLLPDPVFVAALGDLYKLAGREEEAARQYALVEHIARLSKLNGQLYNRQLAMFYADHDMKPAEAYELAKKEYDGRRDVLGADALAWTAFKAGKVPEAQAAIKEALRFNTQDAKLFYHAGLIARAAGDQVAARDWLARALKLNPKFDPWQSANAQRVSAE
ncbi:MAG: tetratricopeptide repeat protein, partial [Pyrinomonadaceae bacterium]|nr:tetratricopeptide repeat protein [Pyrinomonadaceae bacterium]